MNAFRFLEPDQGGDFLLGFAGGVDRVEVSAAVLSLTLAADLAASGRFIADAAGQFVFDTGDALLSWDAGGAAGVLPTRFDDPMALGVADFASSHEPG